MLPATDKFRLSSAATQVPRTCSLDSLSKIYATDTGLDKLFLHHRAPICGFLWGRLKHRPPKMSDGLVKTGARPGDYELVKIATK